MLKLRIRKIQTFVEEVFQVSGKAAETPLRKIAAAAVIGNPFAGRYVEDLQPLVDASADIGRELARRAVEALAPDGAQSYGKAAIFGIAGEQEQANALLTTAFANPLRKAVGGEKPGSRHSPSAACRAPTLMYLSPQRMHSMCGRITTE